MFLKNYCHIFFDKSEDEIIKEIHAASHDWEFFFYVEIEVTLVQVLLLIKSIRSFIEVVNTIMSASGFFMHMKGKVAHNLSCSVFVFKMIVKIILGISVLHQIQDQFTTMNDEWISFPLFFSCHDARINLNWVTLPVLCSMQGSTKWIP